MWGSSPPSRGVAATGATRGPGQFSFYVSCDINLQVRVKVSELQGLVPSTRSHLSSTAGALGLFYDRTSDSSWPHATAIHTTLPGCSNSGSSTSALYVTSWLTSCGDTLGLEMDTSYAIVRVPAAVRASPPQVGPVGGPGSDGWRGGGAALEPLVAASGGGESSETSPSGSGGGAVAGCDSTARWDEWLTFCVKVLQMGVIRGR